MQFLDEYYSANLPVVLLDVAQQWPAVTKWSATYLLDLFGNEPIESWPGGTRTIALT